MRQATAYKIIKVTAMLAVLISLFLLYQHYAKESSRFCNFGKSFSCDIVNKGEYSTVDGVANLALSLVFGANFYLNIPIPNSLISVMVFGFMFFVAHNLQKKKSFLGMREGALLKAMQGIMVASILYALFLIYIEAAVLYSWCLFCLALDAVMLVMAVAVFRMKR